MDILRTGPGNGERVEGEEQRETGKWRMVFGQRSRTRVGLEVEAEGPSSVSVFGNGDGDNEQDGDVAVPAPPEDSQVQDDVGFKTGLGMLGMELGMGGTSRFHVLARVSIADRSVWLPLRESSFLPLFPSLFLVVDC